MAVRIVCLRGTTDEFKVIFTLHPFYCYFRIVGTLAGQIDVFARKQEFPSSASDHIVLP